MAKGIRQIPRKEIINMITNNSGHKNGHINTALILAAGRGVRCRDMVSDRPKGFLEMNAFPIIERSVMQL